MHSPRGRAAVETRGSSTAANWDTPTKRQSLELTAAEESPSSSASGPKECVPTGGPKSQSVPLERCDSVPSTHVSLTSNSSHSSASWRNDSSPNHVRLMAELLLHQRMAQTPPPPLTNTKRLHRSASLPPQFATTGQVRLLGDLLKDKIPMYAPTPRDMQRRYQRPEPTPRPQVLRRCESLPPQLAIECHDGRLPSGHVGLMADFLKDKIPLWAPLTAAPKNVSKDDTAMVSTARPTKTRSFHRSASLPVQLDDDRLPAGHVQLMADYLRDKIPVWTPSRTPLSRLAVTTSTDVVSSDAKAVLATLPTNNGVPAPAAFEAHSHGTTHQVVARRNEPPRVHHQIYPTGSQHQLWADFFDDKVPLWQLVALSSASDSDLSTIEPFRNGTSVADLLRRQRPQRPTPVPCENDTVQRETQSNAAPLVQPHVAHDTSPRPNEPPNVTMSIPAVDATVMTEPPLPLADPSLAMLQQLVVQLQGVVHNCTNQSVVPTRDCSCCDEVSKLLASLPSGLESWVSPATLHHATESPQPSAMLPSQNQPTTCYLWYTFLDAPVQVDRKPLFPCLFQVQAWV